MFFLSKSSKQKLINAHPDLQKVVKHAITITPIDFRVHEVLRTKERQKQLVESEPSWTMNSRHLTGHAVDLVALMDGKVSWHWPHYYLIAEAMKQAALQYNVKMVFGGVWDKKLNELGNIEHEVAMYVHRRRALGKEANIDGPHYELDWDTYPI